MDVTIVDGGTVFIVTGISDLGKNWIQTNLIDVNPECVFMGENGVVVEHRYIQAVTQGLLESYLKVEKNGVREGKPIKGQIALDDNGEMILINVTPF